MTFFIRRYVVDVQQLDTIIFDVDNNLKDKDKETLHAILTTARNAKQTRNEYQDRCEDLRTTLTTATRRLSDLSRSVHDIHEYVEHSTKQLDTLRKQAKNLDSQLGALLAMLELARPDLYNKIPFVVNPDEN